MITNKKFKKKFFVSLLILGILALLVYTFYINQERFGRFNLDNIDVSFSNVLNGQQEKVYLGEIVDYNKEIPACKVKGNRTIILRLDDVKAWQYYNITTKMTDEVLSRNMALTLSVIPKDIEKDTKLFLPWINDVRNNPNVEIALHGYLHEESEFQSLSREEAAYRLQKGKDDLIKYIGIVPVSFVPPENEFSDGTVDALADTGFRVLAAGDSIAIKQYFEIGEKVLYLGKTTQTYNFDNKKFIPADQVLEECNASLDETGLCVIMIHPQDYLTADRTQIDEVRYDEFIKMLDGLENLNASFKNFKDVANCTPEDLK